MKNHLFKASAILLLLIIGWGCKKENQSGQSPDQLEINKLELWYKANHVVSDQNIFSQLQPNWKTVYVEKVGDQNVYELALENPQKLMVRNSSKELPNLDKESKKHIIKLLIFEDVKSDKIQYASYMTAENEVGSDFAKVHYKNVGDFTGTIYYYHLGGGLSNGWIYDNGKIKKKLTATTEVQYQYQQKQYADGKQTNNVDCYSLMVEHYMYVCVYVGSYSDCRWQSMGYSYVEGCVISEETEDVPSDVPGGYGGGGGGGTSGVSSENPKDAYLVETFADSISLKKKLDCFKNVPDNANTVYMARIYADLPNDANPNALIGPDRVGHAFVTMTKTNGSNSITQTFGFYPEKGIKSTSGLYVSSQIEDDGATQHQYNASYSVNLGQLDFERMINAAKTYSELKYNLNSFNCTDYALAVFNTGLDNNNQLVVPDWIFGSVTPTNYGTTPTGLYKKIKEMKDKGKIGATTSTGNAPSSTYCN